MHRKLGSFRGDAPLEAWLYRIVRYAAAQRQRRTCRRDRLGLLPAAQPEREVYLTDPGARVDRQQVAETVRAYFERLPSRQREIFDLVDLQGYEPVEVALMTGLKPATVRSNLFKARAAVRAHFIELHPAASELLRWFAKTCFGLSPGQISRRSSAIARCASTAATVRAVRRWCPA